MTSPQPACEVHRAALAAPPDHPGQDIAAAEAHVRRCGRCRSFAEGLERLQRIVDDSVVPPGPDLVPLVVTAPPPPGGSGVRRRRVRWSWEG